MLNERQRRFIEEYVRTGNAAMAARQEGYSANTATSQASRLLTNVNISAEIKKRLEEMHDARIADLQEVLRFLTASMRGEITEKIAVPINGKSSRVEVIEVPIKAGERIKAATQLLKVFSAPKDEEEVPDTVKIIRAEKH